MDFMDTDLEVCKLACHVFNAILCYSRNIGKMHVFGFHKTVQQLASIASRRLEPLVSWHHQFLKFLLQLHVIADDNLCVVISLDVR